MKKVKLVFIEDFTEYPGGRLREFSEDSGEDFFEHVLRPKFIEAKGGKLEINLDGAAGYASSFLDEAFGRLAHEFGVDNCLDRIEFIYNEGEMIIGIIKECMKEWDELGPPKRK